MRIKLNKAPYTHPDRFKAGPPAVLGGTLTGKKAIPIAIGVSGILAAAVVGGYFVMPYLPITYKGVTCVASGGPCSPEDDGSTTTFYDMKFRLKDGSQINVFSSGYVFGPLEKEPRIGDICSMGVRGVYFEGFSGHLRHTPTLSSIKCFSPNPKP